MLRHMRVNRVHRPLFSACVLGLFLSAQGCACAGAPAIGGCPIFPDDNIWNARIDSLPVHPSSSVWVSYISTSSDRTALHPDFGPSGGYPYDVVGSNQPKVAVTFGTPDESDPGPYPIPPNAHIEGGPNGTGDRHVFVLDKDNRRLYELFSAFTNGDGTWRAGSGAMFDLTSNALRPDGWTSADAAGLPILPGLVRFDEIAGGEIAHALRFTAYRTGRAYLWPARHYAPNTTDAAAPPMGLRLRLKASYDISGFNATNQVILRALKKYGMMLADNGGSWFLSGANDPRFDDDLLNELKQVPGTAFEAVDCTPLMVDYNSGAAGTYAPGGGTTGTTTTISYPATKDTCFNKGAPNNYYGTAAILPRAEKGGDPYWDVANGFLLVDFDRAAILRDIETALGHPGTLPTLTELSRVTLSLKIMASDDMTAVVGVPAVVNSASGANWTEAGAGYLGVDAGLGGAITNKWKDQNGAAVANLRTVLQNNDGMTGGMVRNATGQLWAAANTYTTWKLDSAVIRDFLTGSAPGGTFGVAGITIVTDGSYFDNNVGAYARESVSPSRGPCLELVGPKTDQATVIMVE